MTGQSQSNRLALLGGTPTVSRTFARYNPIGEDETRAAAGVVASGVLSKFLGEWHPDFYGGPNVLAFERQCEEYFGVEHAVSVNSWTSGLIAAVGAVGIEPGDEVIVSPWTMSASATAILHWNAIPVFADIESETFCLDPQSVEANITPQTRGIMAVDIFGQSADTEALMALARKHDLRVISDTAQAPGAMVPGGYAGTKSDVGGFSLNYHKHIHTGEGGIAVTDDPDIAERMRLIRNHAEAVVGPRGIADISNMVGYNFRLGEIEAAIGLEQLKKLKDLVRSRQTIAARLDAGLAGLTGLVTPTVRSGSTHVYYNYAMTIQPDLLGVDKRRIVEALTAEGVPGLSTSYTNLHLLPLFQRKIAYGAHGFPWSSDICRREVDYSKGICPVAEQLQDETYIGFSMCEYELGVDDVEEVIAAFHKVWNRIGDLA